MNLFSQKLWIVISIIVTSNFLSCVWCELISRAELVSVIIFCVKLWCSHVTLDTGHCCSTIMIQDTDHSHQHSHQLIQLSSSCWQKLNYCHVLSLHWLRVTKKLNKSRPIISEPLRILHATERLLQTCFSFLPGRGLCHWCGSWCTTEPSILVWGGQKEDTTRTVQEWHHLSHLTSATLTTLLSWIPDQD